MVQSQLHEISNLAWVVLKYDEEAIVIKLKVSAQRNKTRKLTHTKRGEKRENYGKWVPKFCKYLESNSLGQYVCSS